jgi:topoisomerase-4 subunit A
MGKPVEPPPEEEAERVDLKSALEERYLAYALSTIMHRALPDARDGLKPVHRRILHAMRLLRLDPGRSSRNAPASSATSSASTTRMATSRSMTRWCAWRRTLPSATRSSTARAISAISTAITPPPMRYTEARMTEVARLLLDGIEEDAVDFRETYDGEDERADRAPRRLPEPARQRLAGHRGRHGDLDPAAQRRRALRCRALR